MTGELKKYNISDVVSSDLCVSCGACKAVCKSDAINLKFERGLFLPQIDTEACLSCGKCRKVCPSTNIDVQKTYGELDLSRQNAECYIAYSKDSQIRQNSASGGIVSTLIYELLKMNIYDKAYVLEYETFTGKRAQVKPVWDVDDILKAARSKYIPASIDIVVSDIAEGKIGKAIVVCTPCQLLAIKRSLALYKSPEDNILFIGLFCECTLNYNIYNYYSEKYGKFDSLHFKDKYPNGWPGDTLLGKKDESVVIDRSVRMSLKPYFKLHRCLFCFDKLNQLADISCGDCYIEGQEDKKGKSNIIIRSEKGRMAFSKCGYSITSLPTEYSSISESQQIEAKRVAISRCINNRQVFKNFTKNDLFKIAVDETYDSERQRLTIGARYWDKEYVSIIDKRISIPKKSIINQRAKWLLHLFSFKKKGLKILIDNADFINKGAELMLVSCIQQIQSKFPDAQIVVPKDVFNQNPSYFVSNKIVPLQKQRAKCKNIIYAFIYGAILHKNWFVDSTQIDVVLDAGGFQFSDQWKPTKTIVRQKERYYSSFSKKGRKIIFLPQAFGPFEEMESKDLIEIVYKYATLLFARERTSLEYLMQIFPNSTKIQLAPDFTCLCNATGAKHIMLEPGYVLIIPNSRMITHTDSSISTIYFQYIIEIIQYLDSMGERVILLNHENKDDEQLLCNINYCLNYKYPILTYLDALEVKRIISGAKLVISSRFHGIVNGLTQHVPTLCTSWSHKYQELLKEHHCENNILSIEDIEKDKSLILSVLQSPQKHISQKGCIESIQNASKDMWDVVFALISE